MVGFVDLCDDAKDLLQAGTMAIRQGRSEERAGVFVYTRCEGLCGRRRAERAPCSHWIVCGCYRCDLHVDPTDWVQAEMRVAYASDEIEYTV